MPDTIKNNLAWIGSQNRQMGDELARLPEVGRFKSDSTRLALDNLLYIYRLAPNRFDHLFDHLYTIGLPARRKYCSPLQALLWMSQDGKLRRCGMLLGLHLINPINHAVDSTPVHSASMEIAAEEMEPDYALTTILDAAWVGEADLMLGSTINTIIRRLQAKSEAKEYAFLAERHSNLQLQSYIMDDFLRKRDVFSVEDWPIIEHAIRCSRWKQFYTVADRLNSPELISYYINKYFFFRKTPARGVYFTFFEKKAQCTDAAFFAQFMLERAGYRTFMRSVKWDNDPWDGLHTGAGVILDDGRYLLVSNYTGINAISGPFRDVDHLDEKLSCQRKIIDRKWGAYYPPRYF